jgi:tetratricopeptide (TPR) repeat protein
MDVISLAALLANMADMLANPLEDRIQHGLDRIAIGKLYADLGYLDIAVKIYQLGLQSDDLQSKTYWYALKELSFIHKKQSDLSSACHLWEQAANNKQIYAHIELAKVFEHQQKDFSTAIHWTQSAIEIVSEPDYPLFEREFFLPELEHRLERLIRKFNANS